MPKLTIDNKELDVAPGTTIIRAAQGADIPIAHYCYHEALSIAGVCRMCVVEIEGNPKLQIACNTPVVEGMKVKTDSAKVKEAVKWALDFHLINHPLDCPICDQAGECKLQDYYMTYGLYSPEMNQRKVKKSKVVSLGDRVVLDQERCILCSRCVRFCKEVTKTDELGIFNRGDQSVLATFEGRPMNNNYSVNTVDICPVGALTSKDFRFKQRVWFLKDFDTVCNGCSTGCNITVSYNQNGVFRVRPKVNKDVNGYWMCDTGRDIYKHSNKEYRLDQVVERNDELGGASVKGKPVALAVQEIAKQIKSAGGNSVGFLLTAQYTNEEYEALSGLIKNHLNGASVYYWKNNESNFDSFDGLLLRGDRNPNTKGMQECFSKLESWADLKKSASSLKTLVVVGPEDQSVYPDVEEKIKEVLRIPNVVILTSTSSPHYSKCRWQIPMKSFVEKNGTFTNVNGIKQKIRKGTSIIADAIGLDDFAKALGESFGGIQ